MALRGLYKWSAGGVKIFTPWGGKWIFGFGQKRKLNELREFPIREKVLFSVEGNPLPLDRHCFEYTQQ